MKSGVIFLLIIIASAWGRAGSAPTEGQAPANEVGRVSGVVVTGADNRPVRLAVVTISSSGPATYVRSAITDDAGRFTFEAVQAGSYNLRASKAAHIANAYRFTASGAAGHAGEPGRRWRSSRSAHRAAARRGDCRRRARSSGTAPRKRVRLGNQIGVARPRRCADAASGDSHGRSWDVPHLRAVSRRVHRRRHDTDDRPRRDGRDDRQRDRCGYARPAGRNAARARQRLARRRPSRSRASGSRAATIVGRRIPRRRRASA